MQEYKLESATGQGALHICEWGVQNGAPIAVLQIVHGMAEHIERYARFAAFLNENGIAVVGADTASHGKSRSADGARGYFGAEHGWDSLIADIQAVNAHIKQSYCGVPNILFGHSMGSFLARSYAARHGEEKDAFVFAGTAGKNPVLPIARTLARAEMRKHGADAPSKLLDTLSFGTYNKAFRPNRTPFDWLSRDEAEVDRYVADEDCGFVFSAAGFRDLFDGLTEISKKDWAAHVPKKPILMIAGAADPVGANGKGPAAVAEALLATGHEVRLVLYPEARHELLNETNRDEVSRDVLDFLLEVAGHAAL